jgi:hypothetical protein
LRFGINRRGAEAQRKKAKEEKEEETSDRDCWIT